MIFYTLVDEHVQMVLEKGTEHILVALQKIAPMGDSVQIELRGYELTLRLDEAQKITVEKVHTKAEKIMPHKRQWQWNIRESVNLEERTAAMY